MHNRKSKTMIQQQQQQPQQCFYNYYCPVMLLFVLAYSIAVAAAADTTTTMKIDDVSSHVCTVCKNLSSSTSSTSSSSTRTRRIQYQYQYEIFSETKILPSTTTTSNTYNYPKRQQKQQQQNQQNHQHRNMIVNNSNTILLESSNVTVTNYGSVPISETSIPVDSVSFFDSRTDCIKNCTPGIEFCGNDQMCHTNSCNNLYVYGPQYYTGVIDSTDSSELQCSSISPSTTTGSTGIAPTSIQYGCTVLASSSSTSGEEPIKVPCSGSEEEADLDQQLLYFTEICTAQPAKDITFVCYDLNDTTNFTQYKLNTIPNDDDKCSSSTTATTAASKTTGLSAIPSKQHNYGIDLLRIDTRPESFSCNKVSTILSSNNLIEALAYGTISSVLYIKGNTTKVPVNNNNSTFNNNNGKNNTTELPPPNTGPVSSSTTIMYYSTIGIGSVLTAVVAMFLC